MTTVSRRFARPRTLTLVLFGVACAVGGCSSAPTPNGEVTRRTTEAISNGDQADPNDPLTSAVVQMASGGAGLPTTSGVCTGVLISPRLVLSAAHCFGTDTNGNRGIMTGGDNGCVVYNVDGNVVAGDPNDPSSQRGCGQVVFTDIFGGVREAQLIRQVIVGVGTPAPVNLPTGVASAGDFALAVIDHRALPTTAARATPVRPWLDPEPGDNYWRVAPIKYFGWGLVDLLASDCPAFRRANQSTTYLREESHKLLDGDHPIVSSSVQGHNLGGNMFRATFDLGGDSSGVLLPGDSGGPLFAPNRNGQQRVIGIADFVGCSDPVIGSGTREVLWSRVLESVNTRLLRTFALNPDGSLFGDDVSNPGCFADPVAPEPNDPDCDGVPTNPPPGRPGQSRDNCPVDYNPDQLDSDGDGRGDVCDTCFRVFDDGSNTNEEGEALAHLATTGHSRLRVTKQSVLDGTAGTIIAEARAYFPLDACEIFAVNAPINGQRNGLGLQKDNEVVAGVDNGRVGHCTSRTGTHNCNTFSNGTIVFQPFTAFAQAWGGVTQGWRRCTCPTPDDGSLCEAQCPRRPDTFYSSGEWLDMTIEGADSSNEFSMAIGPAPVFAPDAATVMPPFYKTRWLWWDDVFLRPPPPPPPGGSNLGIAVGRLWWYIPRLGNGRTSASFYGREALRLSVYTGLRLDELSGQPSPTTIRLPTYVDVGLSFFCAGCSEAEPIVRITTSLDPAVDAVQIVALPADGLATDLTSQFSPAALQSFRSPGYTALAASEPSYLLGSGDPSHVLLNADNSVRAVLATDISGRVDIARPSSPFSDPPTGDGIRAALTGRGRMLVLAGVPAGGGNGQIWRNDLDGTGWHSVSVTSTEKPGFVHAITVAGLNGDFYAIDELNRGTRRATLRLIHIDVRGSVQRIASWRRTDRRAQFALSAGYGSGLVLGVSTGDDHRFVSITLEGLRISRASIANGEGRIAVGPRATRQGIVWEEVSERHGTRSRLTQYREFRNLRLEEMDDWF